LVQFASLGSSAANYIQSNTVNQIEMWQQDTFDGDRIDMELSWAENLGINTLRVFLHEHALGSRSQRSPEAHG
jgi:endo-1,4-beta-mannosidase